MNPSIATPKRTRARRHSNKPNARRNSANEPERERISGRTRAELVEIQTIGAGVSAEVIDPRTLKPLDLDSLAASVRRINRLVVVYEGWKFGGLRCGDDLS